MADLPPLRSKTDEFTVLQFDPPYPLYPVGEDGGAMVDEPLTEKHMLNGRMPVAMPNPWNVEEERFLPGIAYGDGVQFVLDVGQSFGSIEFDEEHGWCVQALIPKNHVMARVIPEVIAKLQKQKQGSFTKRLLSKPGKKPESKQEQESHEPTQD